MISRPYQNLDMLILIHLQWPSLLVNNCCVQGERCVMAVPLSISPLNPDKSDCTPQAEAEEFLRFAARKPVDGPDVVSSLVLLGKVLSMQVIPVCQEIGSSLPSNSLLSFPPTFEAENCVALPYPILTLVVSYWISFYWKWWLKFVLLLITANHHYDIYMYLLLMQ